MGIDKGVSCEDGILWDGDFRDLGVICLETAGEKECLEVLIGFEGDLFWILNFFEVELILVE